MDEIEEEDDEKVLMIINHLVHKSRELTEALVKEERTTYDEPGMRGIGVFLVMLKAKDISDVLENLHVLLNIKPEYHEEYYKKSAMTR